MWARRYMSDRAFNVSVATAAKVHTLGGGPLREAVSRLSEEYLKTFRDDGFARDIEHSAAKLVVNIGSPPDHLVQCPLHLYFQWLQFFFANFDVDGSKRRRRLLDGAFFTGERLPVSDRAGRFDRAYEAFLLLTAVQGIPLPPRGWRL